MYVLLEHTKRQVKVFFLSRNAFCFFLSKMAKKQKYLYDSVLVIIENSILQSLDKVAMLGVNTTECFLEEFT